MATSSLLQIMDPVLAEAVNDASKERLRFVLRDILEKHSDTITTASEHLVAVVSDNTNANGKRGVVDNPIEISVKKRKRYDFCAQCEEEFDASGNAMESCNYHQGMRYSSKPTQILTGPGELEMDDDCEIWDDWMDERDGIQDSESSRKDHPEGFIWDCCGRRGDTEFGCKRGPHRNNKERLEYEQTRGDETDEDINDVGYAGGELEVSDGS